MNTIQLDKEYLEQILNILKNVSDVKIFGSRALGKAQKFSDVDICICAQPPPSDIQMELWREAFEESSLPFIVDLCRYQDLPHFIQKSVDTYGIAIKKKTQAV